MAWVSLGNHKFTGMFEGADTGLIRLSVAAPVDKKGPLMIPSLAIKLLRDQYDSANVVAMPSMDG